MASRIASTSDIPISQQHAFIDLAKEFNWEEVKRQLNANPALVNVQPCGREGIKRWSALHQAGFSGDADAVRFLLEHNAAIDAETNDGKTPLDVAKNDRVKSVLRNFMAEEDSKIVPTPLRTRSHAAKGAYSKDLAAMKVMKTSKKKKVMKALRVMKIAKGKRSKALVYKGKFEKTVGGLTKHHLTKNKSGKIVSKKMQTNGKKRYANIKTWVEAFVKARAKLGLTGFMAITRGSPLYLMTVQICKS